MSILHSRGIRAMMAAVALVLAGCDGATSRPAGPPAVSDVPKVLGEKFRGAAEEAKTLSAGAAAAIEGRKFTDAYVLINQLAAKPGLSAEEREAANQARVSVMLKLQDAAAGGDRAAADALEHHRATK